MRNSVVLPFTLFVTSAFTAPIPSEMTTSVDIGTRAAPPEVSYSDTSDNNIGRRDGHGPPKPIMDNAINAAKLGRKKLQDDQLRKMRAGSSDGPNLPKPPTKKPEIPSGAGPRLKLPDPTISDTLNRVRPAKDIGRRDGHGPPKPIMDNAINAAKLGRKKLQDDQLRKMRAGSSDGPNLPKPPTKKPEIPSGAGPRLKLPDPTISDTLNRVRPAKDLLKKY